LAGAHTPMLGDDRWRRQHPTDSVGTNVVSSLLSAVAVSASAPILFVADIGWLLTHCYRLPSTSITLEQRT